MRISLVYTPMWQVATPPLSIALLSSRLRHEFHDVTVHDLNIDAYSEASPEAREFWSLSSHHLWMNRESFYGRIFETVIQPRLEDWVSRILSTGPRIVGFSLNSVFVANEIAARIKEADPRVKIVYGGPVCSPVYLCWSVRPSFPADAVVAGEGEETLVELVERFEETGRLEPVSGSIVREECEADDLSLEDAPVSKQLEGPPRPLIEELDNLPFADFTDFDLSLYSGVGPGMPYPMLPILGSRGCVSRCAFCIDRVIWGKRYRKRSPEDILEEMLYQQKRHGVYFFQFNDLALNNDPEWLRKFCKLIIEGNHELNWFGNIKVDPSLDVEFFRLMKRARCFHVSFGIESASDNVLKLMQKGYDSKVLKKVFRAVRDAGLSASTSIIVGFPGETTADFLETVHWLFRNRKVINQVPSVSVLSVMPSTELYLHPEKWGIEIDPLNPDNTWYRPADGNVYSERLKRKSVLERVAELIFGRWRFSGKGGCDSRFAGVSGLADRKDSAEA